MATMQRVNGREPEEWQQATMAARGVLLTVGGQVRDGIVEADRTGSAALAAQRVHAASVAARSGNTEALREAVYSMTVEGGLWLTQIDLRLAPAERAA